MPDRYPFACLAVFDDPEHSLRGNISAVVRVKAPPEEQEMRRLAADLNQPATTFLWPSQNENTYHIRWFAPDEEIGLCGHGSLAAIAWLNNEVKLLAGEKVISGGASEGQRARMELDAIPVLEQSEPPEGLARALGVEIQEYFRTSNKDIVLLENEQTLTGMKPDFEAMRRISVFGYAVTAPGDSCDFVSRTLVPHVRQLEDHATGSSHAALAPFWSGRLERQELVAIQRSPRGGRFDCRVQGNKVQLSGHYTLVAEGEVVV